MNKEHRSSLPWQQLCPDQIGSWQSLPTGMCGDLDGGRAQGMGEPLLVWHPSGGCKVLIMSHWESGSCASSHDHQGCSVSLPTEGAPSENGVHHTHTGIRRGLLISPETSQQGVHRSLSLNISGTWRLYSCSIQKSGSRNHAIRLLSYPHPPTHTHSGIHLHSGARVGESYSFSCSPLDERPTKANLVKMAKVLWLSCWTRRISGLFPHPGAMLGLRNGSGIATAMAGAPAGVLWEEARQLLGSQHGP